MQSFRIRLITFLIFFASAVSAGAQLLCPFPQPKHEVRAVWLTTIGGLDWPHSYARSSSSIERQKQELRDILDKLHHGGINTVLLQTRVRATTIYPSDIEPWDGCMSGIPGTSPGYDPLAFAIEECHRRGMEIQAWVVTIPVGKWNGHGCRTMRRKYPSLLRKIGDDGYMKPEMSGTAEYITQICEEITRRYDIDGIHLDYIRYPEVGKRTVSREEGRRNITRIVERISRTVKGIKPWVKISCSPIGKHDDLPRYDSHGWNARTTVMQDAQAWLRDGLMDEILPMMYFKGNNFFPFALDWQENSHGRIVAPGLGIYFLSPKEQNWSVDEIKREIYFLRSHGMGHAYFRSKFFTDNVKGIFDFASCKTDQYQALIPPMTWMSSARPQAPKTLSVMRGDNADWLVWSEECSVRSDQSSEFSVPGTPSNCNYLTYNIYRSTSYPVNTDDVRNLVAMRRRSTDIVIPHSSLNTIHYHYAITAMDRYGNESFPLMTDAPDIDNTSSGTTPAVLLSNDGKTLRLPTSARLADADFLIIETMQGVMIATRQYSGTSVSISSLPDGMYSVRTLGKKGVSHRLGFFMIKRKTIK